MEHFSAFLVAIGIFLLAPALMGFGIIGTVRLVRPGREAARRKVRASVCSVDADCPEGYECRDGVCLPVKGQAA